MKLMNRERVDGTQITIGKRVYYKDGRKITAAKFSAEYTDHNGKQLCRSLETANIAQARRKAIKIQEQLEKGIEQVAPSRLTVKELAERYIQTAKMKGAAPKTIRKYQADLNKLKDFCTEKNIRLARQFSENDLYAYRQHLVSEEYADKTVCKANAQMGMAAKASGSIRPGGRLVSESQSRPTATEQVEALINEGVGEEKLAFALMGYAGLRIGEVEQLRWEDIIAKGKTFTMLHIRRGGSNGTTKDRDERFVPIHPRIAELLPTRRGSGVLLPTINARRLLKRLKVLCAACRFDNPTQYKLHTFRHYFASLCANHRIAYRKALAWLGHSSSDILDLYYHLHDEDSQNAMMELARSHGDEEIDPNKGNLRATGESKIGNNLQVPELHELMDVLLAGTEKSERAGFEPAVRVYTHTTV